MEIWKNIDATDLQGEFWGEIPGFPNYMASNLGRIKAISRVKKNIFGAFVIKEKIIKQYGGTKDDPYLGISICNEKGIYRRHVHRLVALSLIPNPENKPHINHKKGVKTDNRISELEWTTRSENSLHAIEHGFMVIPKGEDNWMYGKVRSLHPNAKKIVQMDFDNNVVSEFECIKDAAEKLDVRSANIVKVLKGTRNHTGGFVFRYKQ